MKKTHFIPLLSLSILLTFGIGLVHAAPGDDGMDSGSNPAPIDGSNPIKITIDNPFKFGGTLYDFVETIVNEIVLPVGGVLCVLAFIFAGFQYVVAQGDTSKLKTAHNTLLYTAIGTAVLLGSWVLANVIKATVNQLIT